MYTEINKQLEQAQQDIHKLHKIDSMLQEFRNEKQQLEQKVRQLKAALDKENYDVQKLENRSLASIFHSIFGNLEKRKEKEQSEALAAKLKYDQTVHDLDMVNHAILELSARRMEYKDCEEKYRRLYAQKKELLLKSGTEAAQRLMDLTERLNSLKSNLREIKEATSVGMRAINTLDSALSSLNSAEGWGNWDLLGGGLISGFAKHSHVAEAQSLLRRFKAELADVNIGAGIHIETDGFAKFADFFFDGLIADWVMQSRIHNSKESVAQARNRVQHILSRLSSSEKQISSEIRKLESEIDSLITKTRIITVEKDMNFDKWQRH